MAKPIISIDVDDAKFQKFVELFHAYEEKLADQPAAWDALNKAMGGAGEALKEGAQGGANALALAAAQAELIADHLRDATKAQGDFTRSASSGWQAFARSGQSAAKGVGKAMSGAVGGSIAEMGAGIAGVAETAAAALGPVGLGAAAIAAAVGATGAALKGLADVAVTRQRAAYSLGVTPGQQAAFDVYGQQVLGPGALAAAANATASYANAGALATLGIDFQRAQKMSPSDLAYEMLKSATQAARANPNMPLENLPAIQQYEALGGQLGDVRNALKLGPNAIAAAQVESARNAARLDLDPNAVANAAKFKKAVEGAGITAQSAAINNLSGADPMIAKILNFATGGPSALRDQIASGHLGAAFERVSATVQRHVDPALERVSATVQRHVNPALDALRFKASEAAHALGSILPKSFTAISAVVSVANAKGVDPALALADAMHESRLNPKARTRDFYSDGSFAGYSTGLFQLNEHGEGAGLTLAEMLDPKKNAEVALTEFARVARVHPKWSPGEIAFAAERPAAGPHGEWKAEYIADVNRLYAAIVKAQRAGHRDSRSSKPHVNVHVTNSTASNVAVSANAGAQH